MNFWQSIKQNKLLLCALILAFLFRALNPIFGSPSLYVSNDEAIAHLSALNMIAEKTPVSIANYTPLGAYLQIPFLAASFFGMKILGLVNSISDFELFLLTHEGYFLFIPRLISALFGTLTILVIYKLTLLLFKQKESARVGAFLAVVSFNLVHISHWGRPWSAALFFMLLAVYLTLRKKIISSFILAAVSFGFHQVGILILPLLLIINFRNMLRQIQGIVVFAFLIFILNKLTSRAGTIDAISRGQSFLRADTLAGEIASGRFSWQGAIETFNGNLAGYFVVNFHLTDFVILIAGVFGIWRLMKERSKSTQLLFIFIAGYFIFASLFFYPLLRYLLPIVILLIPFSAYGLSKKRPRIIISVIIFVASINSLWWNWLFLKTPTFIQAHDWINDHIPVDSPIAYTGGRFQTFVPDANAIKHIQSASVNAYKSLYSVLDNNHHDNVRNIVYINKFSGRSKLEQLKNATARYPVEYIVDYYLDPAERVYLAAPADFEIVARFYPAKSGLIIPELLFDTTVKFPEGYHNANVSKFSLERMGPYFEILEVREDYVQRDTFQ